MNGRKRGSVGLLLGKKQSESNTNSILSLVSFFIASGSSSPWSPSSASASDISARATRAYMSRCGAFPRTPALRCGSSGASLFGGRKGSSPQCPPRLVRPLRGAPSIAGQGSANRRSPTPFLVFVNVFVVSLPLRISVASVNVGAHPLGVGRPSENARGGAQGSKLSCLPQPARGRAGSHPCAHKIPAVKDLITAAPFAKLLRKIPSARFCLPF